MNIGEQILLPTDTRLTAIGAISEKSKGNNIPLSNYKVVNIFWEECYYPYPHSSKHIELKKGAGKTYVKYIEDVEEILKTIN